MVKQMKRKADRKSICIIFLCVFTVKTIFNMLLFVLVQNTGGDEIGTIAGATLLANIDWSEVISKTSYYGFGYSIFMTPVFWFFEEPYIIYHILLEYNAVCLGASAVICYMILTKAFMITNELEKIIVSIASVVFVGSLSSTNFITNECAIILILWILLYLLVLLHIRKNENRNMIALSILLGFTLSYGLLIHTRVLFFWGAAFIYIFTYWLIKRKFVVHIPSLIVTLATGYLFTRGLTKYVQNTLWLASGSELNNSIEKIGVGFKNYLYILSWDGIKAFINTVIGQVYGMFNLTGGLMAIFLALICILVSHLIITLVKREKIIIKNEIWVTLGVTVVILFAALFIIIDLGALKKTIIAVENNRESKWYLYVRYWGECIGPALLLLYVYLKKYYNRKIVQKIVKLSFALFLLSFFLFIFYLAPVFEGVTNSSSAIYYSYAGTLMMRRGAEFALGQFILLSHVVCIILVFFCWCLKKKKIIFIFIIYIMLSISSYGYSTVSISRENSRDYYDDFTETRNVVINTLKGNHLKESIYCDTENKSFLYATQFYFPKNSIKLNDFENCKIIISTNKENDFQNQGYTCIYSNLNTTVSEEILIWSMESKDST